MSSGPTSGSQRPATPHQDAFAQESAQAPPHRSAAASASELWRSPSAEASTPVEARALTYEERRDRWRRQAGTLRSSTSSDAPQPDGSSSAETWRGLHP